MSAPVNADDCRCCAGTDVETPLAKFNAPGLPALRYRIGTQPDFKATLLARLSSTDFPGLAALTTRSDDDWTIALGDAYACMADVLTFYQERIVNESYLRTATERRSIIELAALIGYQPAPGVAAATALAFTLETAPGQPTQAAQPVTIPLGTRVQSIPDANQQPQTFETTADIHARAEWNAMPVQTAAAAVIDTHTTGLYLSGIANQLQPGDALLIVGRERSLKGQEASNRWDIRWLTEVETDTARNLTRVAWAKPLGSTWYDSPPAGQAIHVHVFRQRAALFGYNAPDPNLIYNHKNQSLFSGAPPDAAWKNYAIDASGTRIDLDAAYPKIVEGSWFALTGGSGGVTPNGYVELYRVTAAAQVSRSDYGLSAKITRLSSDTNINLSRYLLRGTQVLAHSEELVLADTPLRYPLYGSRIVLGMRAPGLAPKQLIALSGKRQRVAIPVDTTDIACPDAAARALQAGESFAMLAAVEEQQADNSWQAIDAEALTPPTPPQRLWRWTVEDHDGSELCITAPAGKLLLQAPLDDDPVVAEIATLAGGADAVATTLSDTTLRVDAPLKYCYARDSLRINANVAPATHGETVSELAGSGDASRANQSFTLKQPPLTYVSSADDPSGAASTLQVRVNELLWQQRSSLYGAASTERTYALSQDDAGNTRLQFGDGINGARPATGSNNVRLSYRKGLGAAGNLRAGQLSLLLSRPLGVKAVSNPQAATGGQDAETLERARSNAPLRVLTLDRAVSTQDYADFARAYAGVAKSSATWIESGRGRGMHISVAGPDGAAIPAGSASLQNLTGALRNYGDPLLPLDVRSYKAVRFSLKAAIRVADDAQPDLVLAAVSAALQSAYAFDRRDFGQPVTLDEVYAVMHSVSGLLAADIDVLQTLDAGVYGLQLQPPLLAALPAVQDDGSVNAAELLRLDASAIELGVRQ